MFTEHFTYRLCIIIKKKTKSLIISIANCLDGFVAFVTYVTVAQIKALH